MKILILGSNISIEAGGYSESIFLLRDSLNKIKKISVFVLGYWTSKILDLQFSMSSKLNIFNSGIIKIFPFSLLYFKKIISIKPSIIDVQGLWNSASIFIFFYSKMTSTPYIITPRGMLEKWALKKSFFKKKLFYFFFEKNNIKNASCLRATSALEAKSFRELGFKNNIVNVPNSIKIPKLHQIRKNNYKKRYRLLFLSRINFKKGISELLHAWKAVQDKNLDWELVICGFDENNYKKKMMDLSINLKLKRVIWLDYVFGKEKNKIYKSSDLFILLSHSENFGLVIAEALSYRLPVITTSNTPWKSLKKKGCGWCVKLSLKEIIRALNQAMNLRSKERLAMGEKGRRWVINDYSQDSVGKKMFQVYNWILNKGPIPKKLIIN